MLLALARRSASSAWPAAAAGQDGGRFAYSLELTGEINPASAGWVDEALDDAERRGRRAGDLPPRHAGRPRRLDLRDIVKDILAAPMPVVVYVSPNGARAASAGVYITQAADVAAMAPQTNIGSATPISLGPGCEDEVLGRKIRNDAAAYVRALAEAHGRNGDLAERDGAIDAVNVTAARGAGGQPDRRRRRLRAGAARPSSTASGSRARRRRRLETAGRAIESHDMPFQYELLELLVNPTIVFLLLTRSA